MSASVGEDHSNLAGTNVDEVTTALRGPEAEQPINADKSRVETVKTLKTVLKYGWEHKSLILYPFDILSDGWLAYKHFRNGHLVWGALTVLFMILPFLVYWRTLYHMWTNIKYAKVDFKYRFCGATTLRGRKKDLKKKVLKNDGITVYFEDMPQLILQVYTLWKTPVRCLNFEWGDGMWTFGAIAISILSISATVVPFANSFIAPPSRESRTNSSNQSNWKIFKDKVLKNEILFCTFLLVLPKLLLFSWTISILKWYSLTFIVPMGIVMLCINLCKDKEYSLKILFKTTRDVLGYNGREVMRLLPSVLMLSSFLIPLSISLHASINPSFNLEFGIGHSDPFPSSTICFSNSSRDRQVKMWENLTMPWSPTCNISFTAQPCEPEVKERIEIILSCLLVFMSLGLAIVLLFANGKKVLVILFIAVLACILLFGVIAICIAIFVGSSIHLENHLWKSCAEKHQNITAIRESGMTLDEAGCIDLTVKSWVNQEFSVNLPWQIVTCIVFGIGFLCFYLRRSTQVYKWHFLFFFFS